MIRIRSFFLITAFVLLNVGILCGMQRPACSGDAVPFCSVESTCFVPRVDDVLRIPEQLEVYHESALLNYGFDIFSLPQHDPSSTDGEDEDSGPFGTQSYEERSTFFKIHFHIKPEFFFSFANDFIRFFYSNPLLQSCVSKFKITDNPLRDCHFQRDGVFVVPMVVLYVKPIQILPLPPEFYEKERVFKRLLGINSKNMGYAFCLSDPRLQDPRVIQVRQEMEQLRMLWVEANRKHVKEILDAVFDILFDRYKNVVNVIGSGITPRFNRKINNLMFVAGYHSRSMDGTKKADGCYSSSYTDDYVFVRNFEYEPKREHQI